VFAVEAKDGWCCRGLELQDRRSIDDDPRSASEVGQQGNAASVVTERRWEPGIETAQLVTGPVIDSHDEAPTSPTDPSDVTPIGAEHDRPAIK
jgi:hypothetical protein